MSARVASRAASAACFCLAVRDDLAMSSRYLSPVTPVIEVTFPSWMVGRGRVLLPDRPVVEVVFGLLDQVEQVFVHRPEPVLRALRHAFLVPDYVLPQHPPVILQGERDTPRYAHQVLLEVAVPQVYPQRPRVGQHAFYLAHHRSDAVQVGGKTFLPADACRMVDPLAPSRAARSPHNPPTGRGTSLGWLRHRRSAVCSR